MIIRCPECSTGFRLPDERVTEEPIKVRCSKCSHVFQVGLDADQNATLYDTEGERLPDDKQHAEPESEESDETEEGTSTDRDAPAGPEAGASDHESDDDEDLDPYSTQMGTPAGEVEGEDEAKGEPREEMASPREARATHQGSPNTAPPEQEGGGQTAGNVEASGRDHQETLHGVPGSTKSGPGDGGPGERGDDDQTMVDDPKPVDQTQQGTPASGHEPGDEVASEAAESTESPADSVADTIVPGDADETEDAGLGRTDSGASDYDPFPHAGSDVSPLEPEPDADDSEEELEQPEQGGAGIGDQASAREILEGEQDEADELEASGSDADASDQESSRGQTDEGVGTPVADGGVSVQPDASPDSQPQGEYEVGETVITDPDASEDQVAEARKLEGREVQVPSENAQTPKTESASGAPMQPSSPGQQAGPANGAGQPTQNRGDPANQQGAQPPPQPSPDNPPGARGGNGAQPNFPSSASGPKQASNQGSQADRPGSGVQSGSGIQTATSPDESVTTGSQAGQIGSSPEPSGDWVLDEVDQVDAEQFARSGFQRFANYLLVFLLVAAGFLTIVAAQNDWLIDLKKFDQMLSVAFKGGEYEPRDEWTETKKVPVTQTGETKPVEFRNIFAQVVPLEEGGDRPRNVLVLKGDVKNITENDYLGVNIRGKIFDRTGKNIKETEVPLGADIPSSEIHAIDSTDDISELLPQKASRLEAGESQPFTIVFSSIPMAVQKGKNVKYTVELAEEPVPAQAEQ